MNRVTSPETSCIDIPFLVRGRIVEPTADDSVELGGRVGARFRTPNPLRHAKDLVLSNPGELRDLHDTPIDEVIDFLAEQMQPILFEPIPGIDSRTASVRCAVR